MKTRYSTAGWLLLSLLLGFQRLATAQNFPNNGFETWASPYGYEAPANWKTTDDILALYNKQPAGSYYTTTVTKTTDAHGGSFAAKLATVAVPTTTGGTVSLPGFLVLGNRLTSDAAGDLYGGLPYTARPTQMQFYYKLSGAGATTDNPGIQVLLTRTTNGTAQLIGQASATLTPTTGTGYAVGTLTLAYSSSALPDSVTIYAASGNAQTVQAGTTLQLDDITFLGTALAVRADAALQQQLTVSPNPSATGRFVVASPGQPELAAAPLTVFDVTGRAVLQQPAQAVPTAERTIDLSALAFGIYTLRLDSKQGTLMRQLVVK